MFSVCMDCIGLSIIAPILFNIIIHDLPKVLSNNTRVVQYTDDIVID